MATNLLPAHNPRDTVQIHPRSTTRDSQSSVESNYILRPLSLYVLLKEFYCCQFQKFEGNSICCHSNSSFFKYILNILLSLCGFQFLAQRANYFLSNDMVAIHRIIIDSLREEGIKKLNIDQLNRDLGQQLEQNNDKKYDLLRSAFEEDKQLFNHNNTSWVKSVFQMKNLFNLN
jgi:hypothetical protein